MEYELDSEMRSRLVRHYQQVGDEELLDAAVRAEDLTPVAQEVVRAELESRGLGQAWVDPKSEVREAESEALAPNATFRLLPDPLPKAEFGDLLGKGKISLITFYDAIEARHAYETLDEFEIPFEVRDRSVAQSMSLYREQGPVVALELVIDVCDRDRVVKLLRERMGLFPLEEIAEPDAWVDDGSVATVGQFAKRVDAEDVARALSEAKVWNRVRANEEGSAETEDAYLVEVREVDLMGAGELVEKALGLPEE